MACNCCDGWLILNSTILEESAEALHALESINLGHRQIREDKAVAAISVLIYFIIFIMILKQSSISRLFVLILLIKSICGSYRFLYFLDSFHGSHAVVDNHIALFQLQDLEHGIDDLEVTSLIIDYQDPLLVELLILVDCQVVRYALIKLLRANRGQLCIQLPLPRRPSPLVAT